MTKTKNEVVNYKKGLNPDNLNELSKYGFDIQEELGRNATSLSKDLSANDTDEIGQKLVEMKTQIGSIKLGDVSQKGFIGFLKKAVNKGKLNIIALQSQYDSVSVSVDKIATDLESSANSLSTDNAVAQSIAEDAQAYYQKLDQALAELKDGRTQIETELKATKDENRKRQLNRAIDVMSRRQNDLISSQALAKNQYDSMQLLIAGNIELIQDLHTAIHSNIPLWKSNLNIAAIIHRQDVASRIKEAVSDTTNAMIDANAENLKQSSIRIAKEANRPVIDIETIQNAQQKMVEAITGVNNTYRKVRDINDTNIQKLEDFETKNKHIVESIGYIDKPQKDGSSTQEQEDLY